MLCIISITIYSSVVFIIYFKRFRLNSLLITIFIRFSSDTIGMNIFRTAVIFVADSFASIFIYNFLISIAVIHCLASIIMDNSLALVRINYNYFCLWSRFFKASEVCFYVINRYIRFIRQHKVCIIVFTDIV